MKTLHEPPTADPHGGWCGGWGLEASGYPIRPHTATHLPARDALPPIKALIDSAVSSLKRDTRDEVGRES